MRIRTKVRKNISIENVLFTLALFCVSSFALLEHTSITIPMFSLVKYPLLVVAGLCLFTQLNLFIKNILKKKYFYIVMLVVVFCALLLFSCYSNRKPDIGTNPIYSTLRLVFYLIELFGVMIWAAEKGRSKDVINFLFKYTLLLVIVTDFLFFTKLIVFYERRHELYIIGTKFTVSYMHMNLVVLWYSRNSQTLRSEFKRKLFLFIAVVLILAVAIRVDCMTGVIGCLALMVFFMLLNTRLQKQFLKITHPALFSVVLFASVLFPALLEWLISLPGVRFIIESVLGRDTTLTGRLYIFENYIEKLQGHMLWGFGYGNGNTVSQALFGFANAQNALLHWLLETGALTTLVFCALMLYILKNLKNSWKKREAMPFVILIYVYVFLGTVENTMDMSFILWFAVLFMITAESKKQVCELSIANIKRM